MGVLLICIRYLLASMLTTFYASVFKLTNIINDINNPPNATTQTPMILKPNCIDPIYGKHEYFEVNNITIHCVLSGNESLPLMYLVHGYPEIWYSWRYVILHYQKKYRVVACDMRGYGDTGKPLRVEQYRIKYFVADIKGILDILGYNKTIILGNDWGGVIAFAFREIYPELVSTVIGLSTTSIDAWMHGIWNDADQSKKAGYCYFNRHCSLPEMRLRQNNYTIFNRFLLTSGITTVTNNDVDCFKFWFSQPGAATSAINIYRANFNLTYSTKRLNDTVHTTCAIGELEGALKPSTIFQFMNRTYPNFDYTVIPGADHFMIQKVPETVLNFTDSCLSKLGL